MRITQFLAHEFVGPFIGTIVIVVVSVFGLDSWDYERHFCYWFWYKGAGCDVVVMMMMKDSVVKCRGGESLRYLVSEKK